MNNAVKNLLVQTDIPASFPFLIEVWAESDTQKTNVERYVNASEDKQFTETVLINGVPTTVTNTFTASYFKVQPPEKSESGVKDATISFSTVDQTWIEKVRSATERFKVRFIAVIDYDENGSEVIEPIDDITFTLTNATWQETVLQFTMMFDNAMSIIMPCHRLDQFVCPALF